jgi:prevent-host-death family protein
MRYRFGGMNMTIPAADAKDRFAELLARTQRGEGFAITVNGQEVAKLIPSNTSRSLTAREAIARIKANRIVLNPPGMPKLKIKDLVAEGRA